MGRGRFARFVAAAVAVLVIAGAAPADAPQAVAGSLPFAVDEGSVYAGTRVDGERFGDAVAIQGTMMVVGVPLHAASPSLPEAGIVYVYERVGAAWQLQMELWPPERAAYDHFGASVAISGDRVVVGAPGYDVGGADCGGAFVFRYDGATWSVAERLAATGSIGGDEIGASVDADFGTVVVGCPGAQSGRGEVRAYTWDGSTWAEEPVLRDPAGVDGDRLGGSVSLLGATVLASATGDDVEAFADAGSVVSFTIGASIYPAVAKITAPTPAAGEGFGADVDLAAGGYTAVIGSPGHDAGASVDAGRAYVYTLTLTGWELTADLANPGTVTAAPATDRFGASVATDGGDLILVGAPGTDTGADYNDGAAYYYQLRSGVWTKKQDVTPPESPCCREFGDAVALDFGFAAIGAPHAAYG